MDARWLLPLALALLLAGCNDEAERAAALRQAKAEALVGWRKLSRCLVGAPLTKGQRASDRMRLSELALLLAPAGDNKATWPATCGGLAKQLASKLEPLAVDAGIEGAGDLRSKLRQLDGADPAVYLTGTKELVFVDEIYAAASKTGLEPPPADAPALPPEGPVAPTAAAPLGNGKAVKLGQSGGYVPRYDMAPGDSRSVMYGGGSDKPLLCRFESGKAPLDHASCHAIERGASIEARPLSGEPGTKLYYWDRDPKPAVWPVGGEAVQAAFGPTAYVLPDGTVADIPARHGIAKLVRKTQRRKEVVAMRAPPAAAFIAYRAGVVVWRGPPRGKPNVRQAIVQQVPTGNAPLGTAWLAGKIPRAVKLAAACRSAGGLALGLVGSDPSPKSNKTDRPAAVLFRRGGRFKGAVRGVMADAATPWEPSDWWSMSCADGQATFTWLASDDRIGQLRCEAGKGCEGKRSEPVRTAGLKGKLRVADLGGKVLAVGVVRGKAPMTGLTDTVVMRLGPINKLAKAPPRVLLGDEDHGGLPRLHTSIGLMSSGAAAVVLVHGGDDIYALRIDTKGEVTSLAVK